MQLWQKIHQIFDRLSGVSDEELMSMVKNDDNHSAFRALFERHYQSVFARLVRMGCSASVAEEVVQDVFLAVFRSRKTYRDGAIFRPWITVMARNRLIDYHRANALQSWGQGSEIDQLIDDNQEIDQQFIAKEERQQFEAALSKLQHSERELLVLWLDEFSYEEIAQVVDKSVAAIKFSLHHVKKKVNSLVIQEDTL